MDNKVKFCPHCGNEITPNSSFCGKCGYKLNDNANPTIAPSAFAVSKEEQQKQKEEAKKQREAEKKIKLEEKKKQKEEQKKNKLKDKKTFKEKMKEPKFMLKIAIISASSVLVIVILIFAMTAFYVPNFDKMSVKELDEAIKYKAYSVSYEKDEYKNGYNKDIIYNQDIEPGSFNFGCKKVQLKVSLGNKYKIPKYSGCQYSEIKDKLKHFNVDFKYKHSITDDKGEVISIKDNSGEQLYENDLVNENSKITVYICKGHVANVIGYKLSDAKKEYKDCTIKVVEVLDDAVKNKVLKVNENYVSKENQKTTVTFKVSNGQGVNIPEYSSLKSAKKDLDKKGVKYNVVYTYDDIDDVDCSKGGAEFVGQSDSGLIYKNNTIDLTVNKSSLSISEMDRKINYVDGIDTYITFKNTSNQAIYKTVFTVKYFDQVGNPANDEISNKPTKLLKSTIYLAPGASTKSYCDAAIYNGDVAAVAPVSATVYFTDGSEQNITFNGTYWYFDNFHGSSVDFYDDNY